MRTARCWQRGLLMSRNVRGKFHPAADNNWRLAPIAGDKKLDIRFETSPSDKAATFIKEKGQYPMNKVATDDIGFAIYQVDLSK